MQFNEIIAPAGVLAPRQQRSHRSSRHRSLAVITLLLLMPTAAIGNDDALRDVLIQQSIASYPGNCPCPYTLDSAGRRCGKRSAHNRPGGASPLCYREDVTPQMIERFKAHQASTAPG